MKYIRKKDGIYEVTKEDEHILHYHNSQVDGVLWKADWDGKYKSADTIEELIDCYAVILEHQDKPLIVFKNEIEHYKHCLVDKVKSNNRVLAIYGSIWAGADLLSKSKMNDKGELELYDLFKM